MHSLCQKGPQDPHSHQTWVSRKPKSTPRRACGERPNATGTSGIFLRTSSLKSQASSLLQKGQESDLTISPIQLRSCGARERRAPLKSKEDSANAVGIAPMALPLDLAMRVWDSWPKAVGLTGKTFFGPPVSEHDLAARGSSLCVVAARPERFTV